MEPFWPVKTSGSWAQPRGYQLEALKAIPTTGKSITVLPCGAGKTMVGALAASRLRSPTGGAPNILLVTYNREAVVQYARNLQDNLEIAPFEMFEYSGNTAARKRGMSLTCGWKLTHFYMLCDGPGSKLNKESSDYQYYLFNTDWDAIIIDEAHLAPATKFSQAIRQLGTRTKCMISLTATYVRSSSERDMNVLFSFLGNVVYRLRWTDLEKGAYIAKLRFMQIACALSPRWRTAWEGCTAQDKMNVQMLPPTKLEVMLNIVRAHQAHGEIGLIFADGLVVVEQAVRILRQELQQDWRVVVGDTPAAEREELFRMLNDGLLPGLFFSRVGEAANDFRNQKIRYVITVCSAGSSETQFAQRAGRASRTEDVPAVNETQEQALARRLKHQKEACIYDLYAVGTNEEPWASGRVRYLKDEGYTFETRTSEELMESVMPPLTLYRMTEDEKDALLERMLSKAHNAQVERRVHEAVMDTQRQQRKEALARGKRISGMRPGLMRDRALDQERRNRQARQTGYAQARQAAGDRVRDEMGPAQALRVLEMDDADGPQELTEMEVQLETEVDNTQTGLSNVADTAMAVQLSHVPARITCGIVRPVQVVSV
jgi:superfamily II DNA or RNA helicase